MTNETVGQLRFLRGFLRLVWFLAGAGLLLWIARQNLPPSGMLSASARAAEPSGFVGGFTPLDRARPVQEDGLWYTDIVDEPAYFHLAAPRLYDTMRVRLRYRNEDQPYLALGTRTDLDAWSFDLKPIDLPLLDGSGWAARQDGDLRIYERRATAGSAGDLLASDSGRVAVLALDPVRWGLRLPKIDEKPVEAAVALAGPRKLYVYVQDGPLDVTLGFRAPASAMARVDLVRGGETLLQRTLSGDGTVDLLLTGAEPGLYRIDIAAPEAMTLVGVRSAHARTALVEDARVTSPPGAVAFDPEFPIVTWETDLKTAPYDAIVARYRPPTIGADGWRMAEAEFDLDAVAASQGRVQMIVSAPRIRDLGAKIRVDHVEVDYLRPPLDVRSFLDPFKIDL